MAASRCSEVWEHLNFYHSKGKKINQRLFVSCLHHNLYIHLDLPTQWLLISIHLNFNLTKTTCGANHTCIIQIKLVDFLTLILVDLMSAVLRILSETQALLKVNNIYLQIILKIVSTYCISMWINNISSILCIQFFPTSCFYFLEIFIL